MDKDEILERSRKEHKDMDLVELEVNNKANAVANLVGVVVCGILTVVHAFVRDSIDTSAWTVMFSILSTIMLVKYVKLRRRHELVVGLLYLVSAICFFLGYLRHVLEVF